MYYPILKKYISLIAAYLTAHIKPSSQISPSAWIIFVSTNSNSAINLWQLLLQPSLCYQLLLTVTLASILPPKRYGLTP